MFAPPTPVRLVLVFLLASAGFVRAGGSVHKDLIEPPPPPDYRWEVAQETAVTFGISNPNHYVVAPQVISLRWQPKAEEHFFHTPLLLRMQYTLSAVAVPFLRGPEDHYFGLAVGLRHVWRLADTSPVSFFVEGRFAVGDINSSGPPNGQGQDLTFSALVTSGLLYQYNDRLKFGAGVLYEHFSNGGLSQPEVENIGLDTVGPNLSVSYSF